MVGDLRIETLGAGVMPTEAVGFVDFDFRADLRLVGSGLSDMTTIGS